MPPKSLLKYLSSHCSRCLSEAQRIVFLIVCFKISFSAEEFVVPATPFILSIQISFLLPQCQSKRLLVVLKLWNFNGSWRTVSVWNNLGQWNSFLLTLEFVLSSWCLSVLASYWELESQIVIMNTLLLLLFSMFFPVYLGSPPMIASANHITSWTVIFICLSIPEQRYYSLMSRSLVQVVPQFIFYFDVFCSQFVELPSVTVLSPEVLFYLSTCQNN